MLDGQHHWKTGFRPIYEKLAMSSTATICNLACGLQGRQVTYASQLLWASSVTFIRIGLLVFYRRIFAIQWFRIANNVMIGVNVAWWIMVFFVSAAFMQTIALLVTLPGDDISVGAVYTINYAA